ncbi:MAG: cell envelope integrity protein CreD [Muribaculaceae bacterium]|nr:cell envelope integrity protein CreD [Muribaculaceae bacterium]
MDDMLTPPPMPDKRRMSYGTKILLLGLQCGLLMIGALAIWIISYSRDECNNNVAQQIAIEWGGSVYIQGPAAKENLDSASWFRPQTFTCKANVETKSLHRNIYEAEVFNAHVAMSGSFNKDSIAIVSDTVYIELGVSTRQLAKTMPLKIGGKTIDWHKSDRFLFAKVNVRDMPQVIEFSTDFDIHGSGALFIKQIGKQSLVTIDGEAPNPSFGGGSLPDERSLRRRRFSARWESENVPVGVTHNDNFGYVGTNFLVGVDRYRKVSRSLKYAFIIILLTYISVLFTEIVMKRDIPLMNYFLIGAALIIFYSLLLSFSEHMSFGIAYMIASLMTVALIAGYMWKMLCSRKIGVVIGCILSGLYISCYILLSLSTYSLLLGSMILFIALAAMMYGSLQIKR